MNGFLPPHVRLDEVVRLRCALGLRFRDSATRAIVTSGLRVTASPLSGARVEPVEGRANRSGVWTFHGLPGLRAFELGTRPFLDSARFSPPEPPRFRIEVRDDDGRFLPSAFVAAASERGPFTFTVPASPLEDWSEVPLFSAPERPAPPGCAVIRADLTVRRAGLPDEPARAALVRAAAIVRNRRTQPVTALGIANHKGSVSVVVPWPELVTLAELSPPGGLRMDDQGWEFEFAAWQNADAAENGTVDLDRVLARLNEHSDPLSIDGPPLRPFSRATLKYGRELVLPGSAAASSPSPGLVSRIIMMTPAGSPP